MTTSGTAAAAAGPAATMGQSLLSVSAAGSLRGPKPHGSSVCPVASPPPTNINFGPILTLQHYDDDDDEDDDDVVNAVCGGTTQLRFLTSSFATADRQRATSSLSAKASSLSTSTLVTTFQSGRSATTAAAGDVDLAERQRSEWICLQRTKRRLLPLPPPPVLLQQRVGGNKMESAGGGGGGSMTLTYRKQLSASSSPTDTDSCARVPIGLFVRELGRPSTTTTTATTRLSICGGVQGRPIAAAVDDGGRWRPEGGLSVVCLQARDRSRDNDLQTSEATDATVVGTYDITDTVV